MIRIRPANWNGEMPSGSQGKHRIGCMKGNEMDAMYCIVLYCIELN